MAGFGQEQDRPQPFGIGRFDLFHRSMQVADQHLHHPFQPWIGGGGNPGGDGVGGIGFGEIAVALHHASPRDRMAANTLARSAFGLADRSVARHAT